MAMSWTSRPSIAQLIACHGTNSANLSFCDYKVDSQQSRCWNKFGLIHEWTQIKSFPTKSDRISSWLSADSELDSCYSVWAGPDTLFSVAHSEMVTFHCDLRELSQSNNAVIRKELFLSHSSHDVNYLLNSIISVNRCVRISCSALTASTSLFHSSHSCCNDCFSNL